MTAVRKQIKLEEDEDAAQLKFPSEFKTADALLISEVHNAFQGKAFLNIKAASITKFAKY